MKKFTKTHRIRISESLKRGAYFNCVECGSKFWRKPSAIKMGQNRFCSRGCYFTWQKGKKKTVSNPFDKSGENNPNWKGGIQSINQKIRASDEFKNWRTKVFERDNYTCQECGRRSKPGDTVFLHAHHIKPFAKFIKLRFDIDNGQTLCRECHYLKPKGNQVWAIA